MTLNQCKKKLKVGAKVKMTYHFRGSNLPTDWIGKVRPVVKANKEEIILGPDCSVLTWPAKENFQSTNDHYFGIKALDGSLMMIYEIVEESR